MDFMAELRGKYACRRAQKLFEKEKALQKKHVDNFLL